MSQTLRSATGRWGGVAIMVLQLGLLADARAAVLDVGPGDSIQAAIEAASNGDEIAVAPGRYTESIDFRGKAVRVRATAGAVVTVIDGSTSGDSAVKLITGEGPGSVLEGFTVTGGRGNDSLGLPGSPIGGGVLVYQSSPTIESCVFRENMPEADGVGGGMASHEASPVVRNCTFIENQAETGGGMYVFRGIPFVSGCSFSRNVVSNDGGAVLNVEASIDAQFVSCLFESNSALSDGGAVRSRDSSHNAFVNCVFWGNSASRHGGAIVLEASDPLVVNCTIVNNTAGGLGGGIRSGFALGASPRVFNSILWGNSDVDGDGAAAQFLGEGLLEHCDIEGGLPGTGNIDSDPLFVAPEIGDLRLRCGSPCLDAGSDASVPADVMDLDGDGDTFEAIPWDIDGYSRQVDGALTASAIVDLGACELQAVELQASSAADASCAPGSVCLALEASAPVEAISLGLAHDPDQVRPEAFLASPVWGGGSPEFVDVNLEATGDPEGCPDDVGVTIVLVGNLGDPGASALTPGIRWEFGSVRYAAAAGEFGSSVLRLSDCLVSHPGSPPLACTVSSRGLALPCVERIDGDVAVVGRPFRRGLCNADGQLDLSDPVFLLQYLFTGGSSPGCLDACDGDDSGSLDLTDAVYGLNYLFRGGSPPPPPFVECGSDPTPDDLRCDRFPGCP